MEKSNKKFDMEDFRFTIQQAEDIVRLYGKQVDHFLEINIALMTAYSFLLVIFLELFNIIGDIAVIVGFFVYLGYTYQNIKQNLKKNETKDTKKSLCFFRKWEEGELLEKLNKIDEKTFLEEYKNEIENLHKYQKNYYTLAENTRLKTYKGIKKLILAIILTIITGFIGNIIGFFINLNF